MAVAFSPRLVGRRARTREAGGIPTLAQQQSIVAVASGRMRPCGDCPRALLFCSSLPSLCRAPFDATCIRKEAVFFCGFHTQEGWLKKDQPSFLFRAYACDSVVFRRVCWFRNRAASVRVCAQRTWPVNCLLALQFMGINFCSSSVPCAYILVGGKNMSA